MSHLGALTAMLSALALVGPPAATPPTTELQKPKDKPVVLNTVAKPRKPVGDQTLCSFNIVDLEASKALHNLSLQTGVNLVLLSVAESKLTLKLTDVPFVDILRHVCAMSGLQYLKVGSTYVVATEEKLKASYGKEWEAAHPTPVKPQEPAPELETMEVYLTNYVGSTQIAKVLGELFKDSGLVAVAGPAPVSPSVSETDTSNTTGATSNMLRKDQAPEAEGGRVLVLRGPMSVVQKALQMSRQLDTPRAQVSIAVTIHDISNDALKELGISWSYGDITILEDDARGLGFGSFTREPFSFTGKIKALESNERAKLLASPNISVMDGERAFILIGDRINFPVLVGYSQANTPIFDKETERVGIYLQVAASVSSDNQITLSLYPQVSTVTGFLEVNGASYPQISTREAQTTLRVKSGETIVMGGMLRDEEITNISQVPLLSQIPFLGELFKHRRKSKVSSQVILSLTPIVITPGVK